MEMIMPTVPEINEIKKDLYRTKENAEFSFYNSGKLFYTVKVLGSLYQFPLYVVERKHKNFKLVNKEELIVINVDSENLILSEDLGSTSFSRDVKGSDLIRWIQKAIDKEEFIKIKNAVNEQS